jgi:hypothetical protein
MSDTGWINPSYGTDDSSTGASTWANPSYITSHNTQYSTNTGLTATYITHWIKGTSYNCGIPTGATITGIEVQIYKYCQSASKAYDVHCQLINAAGTIGGTDLAIAGGTYWPSSGVYSSYGGSSQLWGRSWAPADLNGTSAGVALSAYTGTCFIKGTKISTPKGYIAIEKLKVGDTIIAHDKTLVKVEANSSHIVDKVICLNNQVTASQEHPFLTDKGFVKLGELKLGDMVVRNGLYAKVTSLKIIEKKTKVYNLSVGKPNKFIANGFTVHNKAGLIVYVDDIQMKVYYLAAQPQLRIQGNQLRFDVI